MRIPLSRLDRQLIARPRFDRPESVVSWFGAMQAQDHLAALWAVGVRTPGATEASVAAALAGGRLVRTHLFRGTWQLVTRGDASWMLELVGPRVIASWRPRLRSLELDDRTLGRCAALLTRALEGSDSLTRAELAAALARGGIRAAGNRLAHILGHAELSGVICCDGRRGRQPTWTLLDGAGRPGPRQRDEALAELARRYVRSRGPATVSDFAWWTGLPAGEARAALELIRHELAWETVGAVTYWVVAEDDRLARSRRAVLLPAFDEYLVGYRDRSAVLPAEHAGQVNAGGGMLSPAVVVSGRVVGTWQRQIKRGRVEVALRPFRPLPPPALRAVSAAAARYGAFLGVPAVTVGTPLRVRP
ncbi:MAG TPA: winged helix DNA-binding domain-containing protein [Gemmatimonadales bacterium]|nr:winged helix DNA-binding domain-containing protein [Gemmatimonadales bacterium]